MTTSASIASDAHGITTVDAHYVRPGHAALFIIHRGGHAAVVESGTNDSVPHLLGALRALGLAPAAVQLVVLTHVHLDHAGGAGRLMRALPNARLAVHPRGAPHLVDPSRLVAASRDVYGAEQFERLYGEPLPIDSGRIVETRDGDRLRWAGGELEVLHTPGHALHHQALHDPQARAVFTGDTFGLSYRRLDTRRGPFIVPTTTPTQFDPEQLLASVERISRLQPEALYLTHFGRVTGVSLLAAELRLQIDRHVAIARAYADADAAARHSAISRELRQLWLERWRACGAEQPEAVLDAVLGDDLELNTQGLIAWLERSRRQSAAVSNAPARGG